MRILLVGNEGYLGSGLHDSLRERHEVIGWGREADIATIDAAAIREAAIDAVVNCAAVIDRSLPVLSIDSATYRVNVDGTRALVDALRGTSVRLIQISTREVYGPVYGPGDVVERNGRSEPTFLVDERRPFAPTTAYAKSKLMGEFIAEAHPRNTVIRLSTCYTDHDHIRGGWILEMIRARFRGQPLVVNGTGKQVRDPLHVDDLAGLIELVLASDPDRTCGVQLNAGGGRENVLSVREIVDLIDLDADVHWASGGDHGFVLDISSAEQLVGWRPTIRFAERVETVKRNVRAALGGGPP